MVHFIYPINVTRYCFSQTTMHKKTEISNQCHWQNFCLVSFIHQWQSYKGAASQERWCLDRVKLILITCNVKKKLKMKCTIWMHQFVQLVLPLLPENLRSGMSHWIALMSECNIVQCSVLGYFTAKDRPWDMREFSQYRRGTGQGSDWNRK